MTEPIDLTDDGEATLYISKGGDEGNRKRVVALAEGLTERCRVADKAPPRKRIKTAVDGVELPAPAPKLDTVQGRGSDMVAAAKASAAASAEVPAPAAPQAGPSQPVNSLLAELHAERLARMSEATRAALRSPAKAEPRKDERPEAARGPTATDGGTSAARSQAAGPSASSSQGLGSSRSSSSSLMARSVSVLTYNLWFNEEVELVARMGAVGEAIEREGYPDFLLFQEVTHNISLIFRQSNWFRRYHCSPVPEDKPYFTLLLARRDTVTLPGLQPWAERDFANSCMGRTILYTKASVGGRPLVVGTSHLESPVGPGPQQMVAQRQQQLEMAIKELEAAAGPSGDLLFAGDLNWSDTRDGSMRLPPRWCDAWKQLMPGSAGLTWDPVANPMLTSRYKGSRLDRVLCRLSTAPTPGSQPGPGGSAPVGVGGGGGGGRGGWQLGSIKLVGTQALPGLTHEFKGKRLPVLPSDHFGLLVKLLPAEADPGRAAGTGRLLGGGVTAAAATTAATGAAAAAGQSAGAVGPTAAAVAGRPAATEGGGGRQSPAAAAAAAATGTSNGGAATAEGASSAASLGPNGRAPIGPAQGPAAAGAAAAAGAGTGAAVKAAAAGRKEKEQRGQRGGGGKARAGAAARVAVDLSAEDAEDEDDVVIVL